MEKFIKLIFLFILLNSANSFSQTLSELQIEKLAKEINKKLKGKNIGDGVKSKGCFSVGRTLIFQYNVPNNWVSDKDIKELLISNLKKTGAGKQYFINNINVDFYYFKNNSIYKKISIMSHELSTYNFKLGDYISTKNHPKAKGVNLKIRQPIDWEIKEGNGPNIIKKFVYENITFSILVKDFITFLSRNQSKELLEDEEFLNDLTKEASSFLKKSKIVNQKKITVGSYPTIQMEFKGEMERLGVNFPSIFKVWYVFYEDKIIVLNAGGIDNAEFKSFERLFFLIVNSVSFPERFE